jgi:hypothetical protein
LFQPRSAECARGGGLERESGRDLWESRELEQWQALAREFGSHWELKLPLVARTEKMLLYDVPLPDDPLAVTLRATSPTH